MHTRVSSAIDDNTTDVWKEPAYEQCMTTTIVLLIEGMWSCMWVHRWLGYLCALRIFGLMQQIILYKMLLTLYNNSRCACCVQVRVSWCKVSHVHIDLEQQWFLSICTVCITGTCRATASHFFLCVYTWFKITWHCEYVYNLLSVNWCSLWSGNSRTL